ncbi:MAG: type II TA system antitoxin MqsA family protein [Desulfobacula sp.]|jgi:putative zinc finger/helix-turn-helix YgiT family protein
MIQMNCPKDHGVMEQKEIERTVPFRGMDITVMEEAFVCPECGLSAGTVESAGKIQQAIAEAYRKKTGLLSGGEIKKLRQNKGMTQEELAAVMDVGIASIKRWETGAIQSRSMDQALRHHLSEGPLLDPVTGNRCFSIPRILRVALAFKDALGRAILKEDDRMLYAAKYLWFADMFSVKLLGRSMTGATYAHLPLGPQLNNYRDLLEDIQNADPEKAEPLSVEELDIIRRILKIFPEDRMVFDAAHEEPAWLETSVGELISYVWVDRMAARL